MTKEEISVAYGVELHTIERFRNIGLVTPKRMDDRSLVYYEADGEKLQRLLLLEKMGFSENNFVMLRSKERTLKTLLQRWFDGLEDGCVGKEICRELLEEEADLESFDAKKYLDQLNSDAIENIFSFKPSFRNQVYRPWRRFFARGMDFTIYNLVWLLFIGFVCHVNLSATGFMLDIVGIVIAVVMMLLIEPLLLNRFGTTFGKWIFGLKVEKADGTHLTYSEGMYRTWVVIGKGEGYQIPIYSLVRLYKSYKLCKEEEIQPWDEGISYTIRDTKWYRVVGCILFHVIIFVIATIMIQVQELPPNRGDITLAEFAENYNYLCKYLDVNEGWYMDEKGQLVEKPSHGTVITIDVDDGPLDYKYEIEDGYLTGVSISHEVENEKVFTMNEEEEEKILIILAFGCTDEDVGPFINNPRSILDRVIGNYYSSNICIGNCSYVSNVEQEGYEDYGFMLMPKEGAEKAHYKMEFSVTKVR